MNNKYISWTLFFAAIVAIIIPWVQIQSQYMITGNISWLLMAAERLLSGQNLLQHIYETNPPLSILIYTPHVIFSQIFGLSLASGSLYLTTIFIIISTITVSFIIKNFDFLEGGEKKALILGYILGTSLITTLFFSDREHIIILTLIPFVLCQYAITNHIKINKVLLISVLAIGSVGILIKPHYGLLPTIFLISRMIKQRRFNIFFDPDFLALTIATISYLTIIYFFFYEYATIILPDVWDLYASEIEPNIALKSSQLIMVASLAMYLFELFSEDLKKSKRKFILLLYVSSLLSLIPYFVQMKGFYNHIIPAYAFLTCAFMLSLSYRITKYLPRYKPLNFTIPFISTFILILYISPLNKDFPKQSEVSEMPVAIFLKDKCPKPCTFFVFHGDIEIFNPTAFTMGYTHGSRFPAFWWLPKILGEINLNNPETIDKYTKLRDKYSEYVAEDFIYYKPSILLIEKNMPIGAIKSFDFLQFFKNNKQIKDIFEKEYKKDGVFKFDRTHYFRGTTLDKSHMLSYDVYIRKDNKQ